MKIISKYKDYYDFLTGIYGTDPLIIYERSCKTINQDGKILSNAVFSVDKLLGYNTYKTHLVAFYICNKIYRILIHDKKTYSKKDELIALYFNKNTKEETKQLIRSILKSEYNLVKSYKKDKFEKARSYDFIQDISYENLNKKYNCPVILQSTDLSETVLNPKLDGFGINTLIPAKEMYLKITEFLSKKDVEIKTPPEDMNRYESKGFDKKTSFRPNIKTN